MDEAHAIGAATHVLVLAHGSRSDVANAEHRELCERLSPMVGVDARPAFLELADPSFAEATASAVDCGAATIVVLPYFLAPGRHVTVDVPVLVDAARAAHPGVTFVVAERFGALPGIVDLLATQVAEAARTGTTGGRSG